MEVKTEGRIEDKYYWKGYVPPNNTVSSWFWHWFLHSFGLRDLAEVRIPTPVTSGLIRLRLGLAREEK